MQKRDLVRKIEACSEGVILVNIRPSRWPLIYTNEGFSAVTGTRLTAQKFMNIRTLAVTKDYVLQCIFRPENER